MFKKHYTNILRLIDWAVFAVSYPGPYSLQNTGNSFKSQLSRKRKNKINCFIIKPDFSLRLVSKWPKVNRFVRPA